MHKYPLSPAHAYMLFTGAPFYSMFSFWLLCCSSFKLHSSEHSFLACLSMSAKQESRLPCVSKVMCAALRYSKQRKSRRLREPIVCSQAVNIRQEIQQSSCSSCSNFYHRKRTCPFKSLHYNVFAHTSQLYDCCNQLYLVRKFSRPCIYPQEQSGKEQTCVQLYNIRRTH